MEDLKRAVYNMHSTFMDPKTFIKFIDARGQYFHPYMGRLPLSNIADANMITFKVVPGSDQRL
jgi:hypothetical protein